MMLLKVFLVKVCGGDRGRERNNTQAISDSSKKTKSQTSPNTALSDANDAFSTRHNMFPFGKTGDYINS